MAQVKARWACQNEAVVSLRSTENLFRSFLNEILFCSYMGLSLWARVSLRNIGEADLLGFAPADFGGAHRSSAWAMEKL